MRQRLPLPTAPYLATAPRPLSQGYLAIAMTPAGYRVIDKSSTYRADPKVPLVTSGVNGARVDETVRLVANPNCTTIPLSLALQPLLREYGL